MTIKDSYGSRDDDALPEYKPLFYSISDISVTSEVNGLGLGNIENYHDTPQTSFKFEISGDNSVLSLEDVPIIRKKVHYH